MAEHLGMVDDVWMLSALNTVPESWCPPAEVNQTHLLVVGTVLCIYQVQLKNAVPRLK